MLGEVVKFFEGGVGGEKGANRLLVSQVRYSVCVARVCLLNPKND